MVSATATRAYAANNESTPHFLAQHVMFAVAVPLLVDVALQLYGLLSKRIVPSGWIDATSLFLRLLNVVALILYSVAAGNFVSFVNAWTSGQIDCVSSSIEKIGVLNTVADVIEILILLIGCACLFMARWKHRMETGVLVIQYLLYVAFAFHFFWRTIHDLSANNTWKRRLDKLCVPLDQATSSESHHVQAHTQVGVDWPDLRGAANAGMNSTAVFWLLAILPVFRTMMQPISVAATLLMAANLPRYMSATPQPIPEADSVRYKLCYNEDSKKMEFQRREYGHRCSSA
ncbi:hypothetical protein CBS101457_001743 [Exobasidium rhododendri]|nr:hypothetical protein CBS101457_001743 [Exobasidium rhododendri]